MFDVSKKEIHLKSSLVRRVDGLLFWTQDGFFMFFPWEQKQKSKLYTAFGGVMDEDLQRH